ncbi:odorant receptor Or1-like [Prorops nasuta]|uniref:odorant receptor Or1-like n=1 Tax=Prorops nasuta TaxID=863751 RepID=UPI0034CF525B
MHIFPEGFFMLSSVGMWRPISWTSRPRVILYGVYNVFVLMSLYSLSTGQLIHLIMNIQNFEEVAKTTVIMLSIVNTVFKGTMLFFRRSSIIRLSERFLEHPMRPMNAEEESIELKFNIFTRKIIIAFAISIFIVAIALILQSAFLIRDGILITPCWYPYDNSKPKFLAISWFHQAFSYITGGFTTACCDTIFAGLLMKICSQLEMLKLRFYESTTIRQYKNLDENHRKIRERRHLVSCINHHIHIFKYARDLNQIFSPILFGQFFIDIMLICVLIYSLSVTPPSMELIPNAMYLAVIFAQVFFYCWFGNEVILSSSQEFRFIECNIFNGLGNVNYKRSKRFVIYHIKDENSN